MNRSNTVKSFISEINTIVPSLRYINKSDSGISLLKSGSYSLYQGIQNENTWYRQIFLGFLLKNMLSDGGVQLMSAQLNDYKTYNEQFHKWVASICQFKNDFRKILKEISNIDASIDQLISDFLRDKCCKCLMSGNLDPKLSNLMAGDEYLILTDQNQGPTNSILHLLAECLQTDITVYMISSTSISSKKFEKGLEQVKKTDNSLGINLFPYDKKIYLILPHEITQALFQQPDGEKPAPDNKHTTRQSVGNQLEQTSQAKDADLNQLREQVQQLLVRFQQLPSQISEQDNVSRKEYSDFKRETEKKLAEAKSSSSNQVPQEQIKQINNELKRLNEIKLVRFEKDLDLNQQRISNIDKQITSITQKMEQIKLEQVSKTPEPGVAETLKQTQIAIKQIQSFEYTKKIASLEKICQDQMQKIATLESNLQKQSDNKIYTQLKYQIEEIAKNTVAASNVRLNSDLSTLKSQLNSLSSQQDRLKQSIERNSKIAEAYASYEKKIDTLQKELERQGQQQLEMTKKLDSNQRQMQTLGSSFQNWQNKQLEDAQSQYQKDILPKILEQLQLHTQKIEDQQKELSRLKDLVQILQQPTNQVQAHTTEKYSPTTHQLQAVSSQQQISSPHSRNTAQQGQSGNQQLLSKNSPNQGQTLNAQRYIQNTPPQQPHNQQVQVTNQYPSQANERPNSMGAKARQPQHMMVQSKTLQQFDVNQNQYAEVNAHINQPHFQNNYMYCQNNYLRRKP